MLSIQQDNQTRMSGEHEVVLCNTTTTYYFLIPSNQGNKKQIIRESRDIWRAVHCSQTIWSPDSPWGVLHSPSGSRGVLHFYILGNVSGLPRRSIRVPLAILRVELSEVKTRLYCMNGCRQLHYYWNYSNSLEQFFKYFTWNLSSTSLVKWMFWNLSLTLVSQSNIGISV